MRCSTLNIGLIVVVFPSEGMVQDKKPQTECKKGPVEVGFLIEGNDDDTSQNKEGSFRKSLNFVKRMAKAMKVTDLGTHMGLVVYGKKPVMSFDFNEHFDPGSIRDAVKNIESPGKGADIGKALRFVQKQLFENSARPGVPKALILITSKKSDDAIHSAAKSLRQTGVKIYAVGLGSKADQSQMNDEASGSNDMLMADETQLANLINKMASKVCQGKCSDVMCSDVTLAEYSVYIWIL